MIYIHPLIPRTDGKKRDEEKKRQKKGFPEKKKWVSKIDDRLQEKDILS